jgi:hypothetical protein
MSNLMANLVSPATELGGGALVKSALSEIQREVKAKRRN